jgi:large subunit ribosomal protein L1
MAGKKFLEAKKIIEDREYELDEALDLLPKIKTTKFDETVEISLLMGIDPKQSDQNIRGVVNLPAGTGKQVKVLVFAKGEKEKEAQESGADFTGAEDLAKKVEDGWVDFDVAIATPDMMGVVGKLGKVLGPRGLMPNPKLGTVTEDVSKAIKEAKGGRIEFRVDKLANIHVPTGKASFKKDDLRENISAFINALIRVKPQSAKGQYIKECFIGLTMSPSIKLNVSKLVKAMKTT